MSHREVNEPEGFTVVELHEQLVFSTADENRTFDATIRRKNGFVPGKAFGLRAAIVRDTENRQWYITSDSYATVDEQKFYHLPAFDSWEEAVLMLQMVGDSP